MAKKPSKEGQDSVTQSRVQECERAEEALKQDRFFIENALNTLKDIFFVFDLDGRFLRWNKVLGAVTRYSDTEISSMRPTGFFSGDDADKVADAIGKTVKEGGAIVKAEIVTRDGRRIPYEFTGSLLRDRQGRPIGICGTGRDVTERIRMESELRELAGQLDQKVKERTVQLLDAQEELVRKEKLAAIGKVAAGVGHEIRNPLGVINNAVFYLNEVLKEAGKDVLEHLDIIREEVMASERIISDLLDFSHTRTPVKKNIQARELIGQALRDCEVPEGVTLEVDLPETLSAVDADPSQMARAFAYIIKNAIDAMSQAGTLRIKAEEDREAGDVKLSFTDTGPGILPENMEKLFQPLFTTKARGLGLQLAIVKNLTEANGGKIEAQSLPGKGAAFTFTLPAARPEKGGGLDA